MEGECNIHIRVVTSGTVFCHAMRSPVGPAIVEVTAGLLLYGETDNMGFTDVLLGVSADIVSGKLMDFVY
jgi:hypothetical protein